MLKHARPLLCLGLLLAGLSAPAHAVQWKWRDAEGQIQYSDRPPPPHVADKDILKRPRTNAATAPVKPVETGAAPAAPMASAPALPTSDKKLEAERKKAKEAEDARKQEEQARQDKSRAEECARAKSYHKDLEDGIRIARTNSKGEREILDDQARAAEKARMKEAMSSLCK